MLELYLWICLRHLKNSLQIMQSYLSICWQRTKINTSFSSWSALLKGVPPGSVLEPVLFKVFLNDLFIILKNTETCNFADDTTPHTCDTNLDELLMRLKYDTATALTVYWFDSDYMKLNADKCHFAIPGNKHEILWTDIANDKIWESQNAKLLGASIDRDLKFNGHMLSNCSKANRKLTILSKMFKYLIFEKKGNPCKIILRVSI